MLGLAPFQNLIAATISCVGSGESMPHHMMMADTEQMHRITDMADDSQQNLKMICCDDAGCALGHCVTSAAPFYTTIDITSPSQMATYVLPYVAQFLNQTFPPLFRPPIA